LRVLILGTVLRSHRPVLEQRLGDHQLAFLDETDSSAAAHAAATAEAIVTQRLPTAVARATARPLRLVHTPGSGFNQIDLPSLPRGVPLCRTLNHGPSMAEHAIMVMIALNRDLLGQDRDLRHGRWRNAIFDPEAELLSTLEGKCALILGTGEIGSQVADRCSGFGMRVLGVNQSGRRPERGPFDELHPASALDELLPVADFLVVTLPLTEATRGLLGGERLGRLRPRAFLVHLSRGPVVDEAALYDALKRRRLAGAAIDVWYRYPSPEHPAPLPSELPFHELDNVILTPHSSGLTWQTFDRRVEDIVANLGRLVRGEPLHEVVGHGERETA
jgi:phosphoglycerate dehydrogenase-like enzyme